MALGRCYRGAVRYAIRAPFASGQRAGLRARAWMSPLILARVLCALITFQLAIGLQPALANSTATLQSMHSPGEACPTHAPPAARDRAAQAHIAHDRATHAHTAHDPALLKHDCCKSSGCQCHCGGLPLAVPLSSGRATLDETITLRPTPTPRAPSALADSHFRPPIAAAF